MKTLAFGVALVIMAVGAVGVVVPSDLIWIAQRSLTSGAFYVIATVRVAFGLVLISVASVSRAPKTLRVLGYLIVIAGITTALTGLVAIERARVIDRMVAGAGIRRRPSHGRWLFWPSGASWPTRALPLDAAGERRCVSAQFNMIRRRTPAIVFATRSGGTTIDRDAFGGNPFATALIQLTDAEPIPFQQFPRRLRALTARASQRHQLPQWTRWPERLNWSFRLRPGSRQERRCALVLIVSEYAGPGVAPLAGAANDERRIAAMLGANGFSVVQGVAPSRAALLKALADFSRAALEHDAAVIYCTGHGVESNGSVYLLPGDYPISHGFSAARLRAGAVSVDRIATACRASKLNLVFFAGCRTLASTMSANIGLQRTAARARSRRRG